MSKVLVVFGATGQQGGSVANFVVGDAELSKQYKVRGVTRDPSKDAAKALEKKGIEVVKGDVDDAASVKAALNGAHTVFAMTKTVYDEQCKAREVKQGKTLADAAVAAGAKYFIFSSQKHAGDLTNGKYPVDSYDSKNEVEQYIRTLPIKSAFFDPGSFMQNFAGMLAPKPAGDGTYAVSNIISADTPWPFIDIVNDTGKFVGAILANPDKYAGESLCAATDVWSMNDACALMSKLTGKTVKYNQIPEDKYRGYLPAIAADGICNMFWFMQDPGYYGPKTTEQVQWAAQQARGKLNTLEDYFHANPIKVE